MSIQEALNKAVEALNVANAAKDAANAAKDAADAAKDAADAAKDAADNAATTAGTALLKATHAETAITSIEENLNLANPSSVVRALKNEIEQVQDRVGDVVAEIDDRIKRILGDIEDLKDKVFGERDTLEAWCVPVFSGSDPNIADHTFVHCPERNAYFNCWALTGDIALDDTEKLCSGQGRRAFCKANRYRLPFPMPPGMPARPDTAGVGLYAINGVCHQSSNLFLVPVNRVLPLTHPSGRPRGVLATYAIYGLYGTDAPGAPPGMLAHFARWQAQVYAPAVAACDTVGAGGIVIGNFPSLSVSSALSAGSALATSSVATTSTKKFAMVKAAGKVASILKEPLARMSGSDRERVIAEIDDAIKEEVETYLTEAVRVRQCASDVCSLLMQYIPDFNTGAVQGTHEDILQQKNQVLIRNGFDFEAVANGTYPRLSVADCDKMVDDLNDLSLEYQSQLCAAISPAEYIRINGDRKFYRPIDPTIARSVLARS